MTNESGLNLKIGDLVRLKSSDIPIMTVTHVTDTMAHTAWFSGKKMEGAVFPLGALKLVTSVDLEGDKN